MVARVVRSPLTLASTAAKTAAKSALRRAVRFPNGVELPEFDYVELPGRGTTYAARVEGPKNAPTLFLFHALACTANLTWFPSLSALRQDYNLVLMDQRWHGRGISSGRFFKISDCADDAAALLDHYGIDTCIPVGYSMGGVTAQMMWRRHPDRVEGLVLCSTCHNWHDTRRERAFFALLPTMTLPMALRRKIPAQRLADEIIAPLLIGPEAPNDEVRRWAMAEFRSTKFSSIMAALNAVGHFDSSAWLHEVDVPTSVVITEPDSWVPTRRQRAMAALIPDADVFVCPRSHAACVLGAADFVPPLLDAVASVVRRLETPIDRAS
jgi:pimeloyl-ACP methyl ester carboxylesterase